MGIADRMYSHGEIEHGYSETVTCPTGTASNGDVNVMCNAGTIEMDGMCEVWFHRVGLGVCQDEYMNKPNDVSRNHVSLDDCRLECAIDIQCSGYAFAATISTAKDRCALFFHDSITTKYPPWVVYETPGYMTKPEYDIMNSDGHPSWNCYRKLRSADIPGSDCKSVADDLSQYGMDNADQFHSWKYQFDGDTVKDSNHIEGGGEEQFDRGHYVFTNDDDTMIDQQQECQLEQLDPDNKLL
eukprot:UN30035